jgi:putative proton-coupled thiamine transporter YuaJ
MLSLLAPTKEDFFMFYDVIVNEWEETTYVPTALGGVLLAVLVLALLGGAVAFARIQWKKNAGASAQKPGGKLTVKQLVFCAMAIALGTVLSNIKLFEFPNGGSITLLSMLVICLPGYFFGLGAGLLTGVAYGVLQLLIDPYVLYPMQLVVDYLLAFGALGLSGLFTNAKNGMIKGYITAVLGRFVFAVISGWIFFGAYAWEGWAPLPYSLAYNAMYIFSEAAITVIILMLPAIKKALASIKKMALE